jgi:integrase
MIVRETKAKWYLQKHALYESREISLNWASFAFGEILKKHDRSVFGKSAKAFMRAFISHMDSFGEHPSPGSISNYGRRLRTLVRWMVDRKIYRFSDLNSSDLVEFLQDRAKSDDGIYLTERVVRGHVLLLEGLWNLRFHYEQPLAIDPYLIPELKRIQRRTRKTSTWSAVPIDLAVPLISDALNWISEEAPHLLTVLGELNFERGDLIGLTKSQMRQRAAVAYSKVRWQSVSYQRLAERTSSVEQDPVNNIREWTHLSIGASIVAILFLTGIRCSELLSLQLGCAVERRLENKQHYWYINGVAAKKAGCLRSWVAVDPVIKTIRFLEDLHAVSCGGAESAYLFSIPNGNGILPPPYVTVRQLWPSTIATLMRKFSQASVRQKPLPMGKRLHPHQARKTFARFVVMRSKHGLEALAQHYGHLYTALLDRVYVGSNFELQSLIDKESQAELEQGLTDLLTSKHIGGKAGELMQSIRQSHVSTFRGKTSITALVKKFIKDGVVLAPCDWGYCVYAQDQSACGGNFQGPNAIAREPNVCATCGNFAVTERHLAWWNERAEREEKFLKSTDINLQSREISSQRLTRSRNILKSLTDTKSKK